MTIEMNEKLENVVTILKGTISKDVERGSGVANQLRLAFKQKRKPVAFVHYRYAPNCAINRAHLLNLSNFPNQMKTHCLAYVYTEGGHFGIRFFACLSEIVLFSFWKTKVMTEMMNYAAIGNDG